MFDVLKDRYMEEVSDFRTYRHIAKDAAAAGNSELAFWISKIARDEYTHIRWLYHHLKDNGMNSPECDKLWEKVNEEF